MFWTFVIVLVAFIFIRFFIALSKDSDDLQSEDLSKKFGIITNLINEAAFSGMGEVTFINKKEYNLYKEGANQIIKFQYGTGHLTITWKYKYYQKEVVHEEMFTNVRNLSIFEQQRIAEYTINKMGAIVEQHKINVLKGI